MKKRNLQAVENVEEWLDGIRERFAAATGLAEPRDVYIIDESILKYGGISWSAFSSDGKSIEKIEAMMDNALKRDAFAAVITDWFLMESDSDRSDCLRDMLKWKIQNISIFDDILRARTMRAANRNWKEDSKRDAAIMTAFHKMWPEKGRGTAQSLANEAQLGNRPDDWPKSSQKVKDAVWRAEVRLARRTGRYPENGVYLRRERARIQEKMKLKTKPLEEEIREIRKRIGNQVDLSATRQKTKTKK